MKVFSNVLVINSKRKFLYKNYLLKKIYNFQFHAENFSILQKILKNTFLHYFSFFFVLKGQFDNFLKNS